MAGWPSCDGIGIEFRAGEDPDAVIGLVPDEGLEPPTFGLQNRCTTAVLTRHERNLRELPAPSPVAALVPFLAKLSRFVQTRIVWLSYCPDHVS